MLHVARHDEDKRAAFRDDVLHVPLCLFAAWRLAADQLVRREDAKTATIIGLPAVVQVEYEGDDAPSVLATKRTSISSASALSLPSTISLRLIEMAHVVPADWASRVLQLDSKAVDCFYELRSCINASDGVRRRWIEASQTRLADARINPDGVTRR
eukprot:7172694-Prymnesium_polylepis.1